MTIDAVRANLDAFIERDAQDNVDHPHQYLAPPAHFLRRARLRRPILGWAASLLMHAVAILWLWHASAPRPASPDTGPARRIAVWLVPDNVNVPVRARAPAAAASRPAHALRRAEPTARTPHANAAPVAPVVFQPSAAAAAPLAPASVSDAAVDADADAPAFDLAAARSSARALAREDRKGAAALALRQDGKNADLSSRLQDRFEHARRGDCLKPNESMNLLANVAMLAHGIVANAINDSGCKW